MQISQKLAFLRAFVILFMVENYLSVSKLKIKNKMINNLKL